MVERCTECGSEMGEREARCPACEAPKVGQPRQAPEGSGDDAPETGSSSGRWNTLVWVGMLVAVVAVAVVAIL